MSFENINFQKSKRISDEGYQSDQSPIKNDCDKEKLEIIEAEAIEFKNKYTVTKMMYNSANGVIYEGYRRKDGLSVCIKQVPRTRIVNYGKYKNRTLPLEFEMHLKAAMLSTGVVKVHDWFERRTSFVLVMEKPANSIDLFELSAKYGSIKEDPAKIIFSQIVKICKHLNDGGVFHRDIKDENILINIETLEVKIIDFGCAINSTKNTIYKNCSGTPEFFAPEFFTKRQYRAESATSWALGTLLYVLIIGDIPFETSEDIVSGNCKKFQQNLVSSDCRRLLNGLLCLDEQKRNTFENTLSEQWIKTAENVFI